jgi:cytoskeletal protein CcmA (bactofilin family)
MFGRKNPMENRIDTLVGPNTRVNGDLSFAGRCHIDGVVKGSVNADQDSDSALSIAEDGTVEGGVRVPYVVLNGIVRGDVFANQRVELGPTARVIGNVYYNLIEMAIGAEINGKLVHQPGGRMMPLDQTDRIETRPRPRPEAVDSQRMESPVKVVTGS